MKIEKISDIQIKCTLNQQDLKDRELHLSELAYGSEKARALFSELLLQASYECGFEAQDVPLMIEAVPMSKDSLVLILTKVTDPEELNVSYSNISVPRKKKAATKLIAVPASTRADAVLKEVEKTRFFDGMSLPSADEITSKEEIDAIKLFKCLSDSAVAEISKFFVFNDLSDLIRLADFVAPFYRSENSIYKDPQKGCYYLVLNLGDTKPEIFNKVCNICAEYGDPLHTGSKLNTYFEEHCEPIIKKKALQRLKLLNKH